MKYAIAIIFCFSFGITFGQTGNFNYNRLNFSENKKLQLQTQPSTVLSLSNVKYEIPKGAVFCRMEEQLRSRLNFWVKLRAGSDEAYMKMIKGE